MQKIEDNFVTGMENSKEEKIENIFNRVTILEEEQQCEKKKLTQKIKTKNGNKFWHRVEFSMTHYCCFLFWLNI